MIGDNHYFAGAGYTLDLAIPQPVGKIEIVEDCFDKIETLLMGAIRFQLTQLLFVEQ